MDGLYKLFCEVGDLGQLDFCDKFADVIHFSLDLTCRIFHLKSLFDETIIYEL